MLDSPAELLARHARWAPGVQAALAADPGLRAWLVSNAHLSPDVATTLARAGDARELLELLRGQRGALPGFAVAVRRLPQVLAGLEPGNASLYRRSLDRVLAHALLRADTPQTAAAAAAHLPAALVRGPATGEVLLALNVQPHLAVEVAPRAARLAWLASAAAAGLDDARVWEAARRHSRQDTSPADVAALCQLFVLRPALRGYDGGDPEMVTAQQLLTLARVEPQVRELHAGAPWARWYARLELLRALRRGQPFFPADRELCGTPLAPWVLVEAVRAGRWSRAQRERLAALVHTWAGELGPVGPVLAAELGHPDPHGAAPEAAARLWAQVRDRTLGEEEPRSAGGDAEPLPAPGDLPVAGLTSPHAGPAVAYLADRLADPDPVVEAARWSLALRLAEDFAGTLADLAAVAWHVSAPAS